LPGNLHEWDARAILPELAQNRNLDFRPRMIRIL